MPNSVHFWTFSFKNSEDQTIDESRGTWNGHQAPHSLWDQDFADSHAATHSGVTATDCPLLAQTLSK